MLDILYEDEAILVVWKPVGMESQSGRGFDADMVSEIRRYLSTKKPVDNHKLSPEAETPYVGVIHRLDKPVSGVMVYAKTKTAAAALSKQVAEGKMQKKYLTVLCGKPVDNVEKYVDYLLKEDRENTSKIVDMGIKGGKRAELICRALETKLVEPYGELTLAEITLLTGRHHQIRVQMSGHGLPIWGDNRYNPAFQPENSLTGQAGKEDAKQPEMADRKEGTREGSAEREKTAAVRSGRRQMRGLGRNRGASREARKQRADVALAAFSLTFTHPVTGKNMTFRHNPSGGIFRNFHLPE